MAALDNVTAGITLTSTTFNSVLGVFVQPPLVYLIGAMFFVAVVGLVKKITLKRRG